MSKRAIIRQLEEALKEADAEIRRLAAQGARAFEMQVTIAALLERLTPDGAAMLPLELRKQAMEEEWGYETMIVDGVPEKPMVLTLLKSNSRLKLPGGSDGS